MLVVRFDPSFDAQILEFDKLEIDCKKESFTIYSDDKIIYQTIGVPPDSYFCFNDRKEAEDRLKIIQDDLNEIFSSLDKAKAH